MRKLPALGSFLNFKKELGRKAGGEVTTGKCMEVCQTWGLSLFVVPQADP